MGPPVTKCTSKGLVFGGSLVHKITNILVTRRTVGPWGLVGIMNYEWLVNRMAYKTISRCLTFCVRLMTHGTFGNFPMCRMAERAGDFCMSAWMIVEFFALLFMASQARPCYIIAEF